VTTKGNMMMKNAMTGLVRLFVWAAR
jgi:hypothetical protein